MTRHSYPSSAMIGDYLRAAAGFVPAVAILASVSVGPVATGVFVSVAALFALFGLRTGLRHATRFEATETGLSALGPLAATVSWSKLDRMKLAYYSTRRDRRDGWMQLELRAGASSIRLDSRLEGFEQLVERSALAAALRELEVSASTAANLEALGIRMSVFHNGASAAEGQA
jgi:hypothetical protein